MRMTRSLLWGSEAETAIRARHGCDVEVRAEILVRRKAQYASAKHVVAHRSVRWQRSGLHRSMLRCGSAVRAQPRHRRLLLRCVRSPSVVSVCMCQRLARCLSRHAATSRQPCAVNWRWTPPAPSSPGATEHCRSGRIDIAADMTSTISAILSCVFVGPCVHNVLVTLLPPPACLWHSPMHIAAARDVMHPTLCTCMTSSLSPPSEHGLRGHRCKQKVSMRTQIL